MRAGVFAEEPTFISTNEGGRLLDVRFEHSNLLWPWSGFLALYIRVSPEGATFKVQPPLSHTPYRFTCSCPSRAQKSGRKITPSTWTARYCCKVFSN